MLTLTKTDIAALRKGDDLIVRIDGKTGGRAMVVKRKPYYSKDPFATDVYHDLTATVGMESMRGDQEMRDGHVHAFAMIGIYHNQHTDTSAILRSLKAGDEIRFRFFADGHSNGYVAAAGLHADVLYLNHYRNGNLLAKWEIATSVTPNNSARMVKGVPSGASYHDAARRVKENA